MNEALTSVELGELRAAVAPLQAQLQSLANADVPDPSEILAMRTSFAALLERCRASLTPALFQRVRAAVDDQTDDHAAVLRALALAIEVDAALAFREKVASYKRSLLRSVLSLLLWLLALASLAGAAVSLFVTLIASRSSQFADLAREALAAVLFYGLLALGFVAMGLALWRRHDPRPRALTGRRLSAVAAISFAALIASTAATTSGASLPILSSSMRYEVGAVASVLPPGTTGWQKQQTTDEIIDQVDFSRDVGGRRTAEDSETLRAQVMALKATGNLLTGSDLIQEALDGQELSFEGGRLTNVSFKVAPVASLKQCQRYDRVTKDTGVAQFPGSVFILTSHGLYCFVEAPAYLVAAEWSHRYLEGTTPNVPESDADAFLESLQLRTGDKPAGPSGALATTGRVALAERFNDKSNGWTTIDNDFARTGYLSPTGYGVQLKRRAHAHVGTTAAEKRRDSYVEVEFVAPAQMGAYYGPTCRVDDAFGSFYLFEVTSDGAYGIAKIVAGKRTTLAHSAFAVRRSLIPPVPLRIGAYCYGDPGKRVTLALEVNGVQLLRIDDSEPTLDRAGWDAFFANGEGAGPLMRLSSFTVRDIVR